MRWGDELERQLDEILSRLSALREVRDRQWATLARCASSGKAADALRCARLPSGLPAARVNDEQ